MSGCCCVPSIHSFGYCNAAILFLAFSKTRVAKDVRGDTLHFGYSGGGFDGALQVDFVEVVPFVLTSARVSRERWDREEIKPSPFAPGVFMFVIKGVGQ